MLVAKPTIYIAHSLSVREKVFHEVIPLLKNYFNIENPFTRRRKALQGRTEEEIRKNMRYINPPTWVVGHDLKQIDKCDGMLIINTDGPSYGATFEMAHMVYDMTGQNGIMPMAIVVREAQKNHPWLHHYCIGVWPVEQGMRSGRDDTKFSETELHAIKMALHSLATFFDLEDVSNIPQHQKIHAHKSKYKDDCQCLPCVKVRQQLAKLNE